MSEPKLGNDLKLRHTELGADLTLTRTGDLSLITNEDNLAQAIIARLATEKGELYDIGHPNYGSRLHEIIGELNNDLTRKQIALIVAECLGEEGRIKQIVRIGVLPDPGDHHRVNIEITIVPQGTGRLLTLTYPFHLEG